MAGHKTTGGLMRILAVAVFVAACSTFAIAQQPAATPPTTEKPAQPAPVQVPADRASYMSAADLAAALAKVPTDRPSSNVTVFRHNGFNVNIEQRNPVAQGASTHEASAELFHILDGSAVMVTGGTIPNATRNGTNLQGKTIEGGTRQPLAKGDWLIIPAGVPHQFADIKGHITIMSLYLPNPK
jgi:mannose-6-phosphate isomerase-like protein (cupin superfamily)